MDLAVPPPPSFSRLPPDGHEFPPSYSEPLAPSSECNGVLSADDSGTELSSPEKSPPPLPVASPPSLPLEKDEAPPPLPPTVPPKKFSESTLPPPVTTRRLWRRDEKSESSVRDKIAMFSVSEGPGLQPGRFHSTEDMTRLGSSSGPRSLDSSSRALSTSVATLPRQSSETRTRTASFTQPPSIHSRSQSLVDVGMKRNSMCGPPPSLSSTSRRAYPSLSALVEQRRKSLSKLRGLVIPEKGEIPPILEPVVDLPEIKSRDAQISSESVKSRWDTVDSPRISSVTNRRSLPTISSSNNSSFSTYTTHVGSYTTNSVPTNNEPPPVSSTLSLDRSSLTTPPWKQPAPSIPLYSPAFKRKSLSVLSSKTPDEPKSLESVTSPRSDTSFEFSTRAPVAAPDSDGDSAVSSSRSSDASESSPPGSPAPPSNPPPISLRRTHSSNEDSDSQDSASCRVLKAQSVEAINRKNVLQSAKYRSGRDAKVGSPLIARKTETDAGGRLSERHVYTTAVDEPKYKDVKVAYITDVVATSPEPLDKSSDETSDGSSSPYDNGPSSLRSLETKESVPFDQMDLVKRINSTQSEEIEYSQNGVNTSTNRKDVVHKSVVRSTDNDDSFYKHTSAVQSIDNDDTFYKIDAISTRRPTRSVMDEILAIEKDVEAAIRGSEDIDEVNHPVKQTFENQVETKSMRTIMDLEEDSKAFMNEILAIEREVNRKANSINRTFTADVSSPSESLEATLTKKEERISINRVGSVKSNAVKANGTSTVPVESENRTFEKRQSVTSNVLLNGTHDSTVKTKEAPIPLPRNVNDIKSEDGPKHVESMNANNRRLSGAKSNVSGPPNFRSLTEKWQQISSEASSLPAPGGPLPTRRVDDVRSGRRSSSINDLRRPVQPYHARGASLDSTQSEDPSPMDQFGSVTSLASSTSLISQQELQQLIDEANQSLESSGSPDCETAVVVLHRDAGVGGVGITLAGGADHETKEVTVHKVLTGSAAERDGRVQKGDRVISINGRSMTGVPHREAVAILKAPRPEVVLVLSRRSTPGGATGDEETTTFVRSPRILEKLSECPSPTLQPSPVCNGNAGELLTIVLRKDRAGLGFSLEGGRDSLSGDRPLTIKKIFTGGSAEKQGMLQAGDELLSVAGLDVSSMSRIEAWNMMKRLTEGDIAIIVRRIVVD